MCGRRQDGEGIADPTEHLTGYTFTPRITKRPNQITVDQFGTLALDVVRSAYLMVPTAKNGVPLAPPPTDHFQCYKVIRRPWPFLVLRSGRQPLSLQWSVPT